MAFTWKIKKIIGKIYGRKKMSFHLRKRRKKFKINCMKEKNVISFDERMKR